MRALAGFTKSCNSADKFGDCGQTYSDLDMLVDSGQINFQDLEESPTETQTSNQLASSGCVTHPAWYITERQQNSLPNVTTQNISMSKCPTKEELEGAMYREAC